MLARLDSSVPDGMDVAIVSVGINDYPIPGSDLKGCVNDAPQVCALVPSLCVSSL